MLVFLKKKKFEVQSNILNSITYLKLIYMQRWVSGRMLACLTDDPGLSPGQCTGLLVSITPSMCRFYILKKK